MAYKDETGNRYGMLTVVAPFPGADGRGKVWLCKCDCGNEVAIRGIMLRSGNNRSCGCLKEMAFDERLERGLKPGGKERVINANCGADMRPEPLKEE